LPSDVFESAAENFLQNALEKRKMESGLRIIARLQWDGGFVLTVCDDGQAVPDGLVRQLFLSAVPSNSGLGVGMYQVARFARDQGYEVALSNNQIGRVCFTLASAALKRGT
jgi:C4-dicarboxylate-specific signal transduction histidine kinase